jgi:periplasmic divalent cation tolerance protein
VPEAIVVMVTCADDAQAEKIAECLVQERLAACANIAGRVRSVFRWQGAISRESETLLLMKTRPELFDRLARRVKELHSYEVPEVIALPIVDGSPDYIAWVLESTAEAGRA